MAVPLASSALALRTWQISATMGFGFAAPIYYYCPEKSSSACGCRSVYLDLAFADEATVFCMRLHDL